MDLADLADAFTEDDAEAAWQRFVAAFGRFWDADRPVMRRLRALAQLDPEVAEVIAARDQRRGEGIEVLLAGACDDSVDAAARVAIARRLLALTSFETFDTVAGVERSPAEVVPEIVEMTEAVLAAATKSRQATTRSCQPLPICGRLGAWRSAQPASWTLGACRLPVMAACRLVCPRRPD